MAKRFKLHARSVLSLIQEDVAYSEWLLLATCTMLNCTTRKQVEKVLPEFISRWPTPHKFLDTSEWQDYADVFGCLGMIRRRIVNLRGIATSLVSGFDDIRCVKGVGEYAARSYEIFCLGYLGETPPNDHALNQYWNWAVVNSQSDCYNTNSINSKRNSNE